MNKRQKKNVSVDRRITRSMSLKNGNENSLPIPIDIIIRIFSLLPLKSVARCRCVSKLWASILRRSDFTELFLSRSCSRTPKLLFAFKNYGEFFIFSSPQPQNPVANSSPVVLNYQMKFSFGGSCNNGDLVHGLICLDEFRTLKICNPSTGQTLILPKVNSHMHNAWWSVFGYDPIGKQYKVLSMRKRERLPNPPICDDWECDEYKVLTIGNGKLSWKMIECCIPHNPPRLKICINGVIYYTPFHWLKDTLPIVCFDVRFEKFSFIKTTEIISFLKTTGIIDQTGFDETSIRLINYNGKLGLLIFEEGERYFFNNGRSISFKLWVLEDLEKQVWSDHTFVFPTVPEIIVGRDLLEIVGLTRTNEIVLSLSDNHYPLYLFYLSLEKKTIVRVEIQGIEASMDEHDDIKHIFLDHVENVKLYGKSVGT